MRNINILILSVGRRVELVNCFKKAAEKLKINSKIIAADMSDTAPALYFSDKYYLIPPISDRMYIGTIINICQKEDISLVIPTIDTELIILSKNKEYIESKTSAKVLISSYDVISCCRDKNKTHAFLKNNKFGVPKIINDNQINKENIKFPLFIKPKSGSSSINAFKVNNQNELTFFQSYIKDYIIQEFLFGDEYTIDAFLDFNSNIISVVPRLRIATRSGEISKGRIVKDQEIIKDICRLLEIMKPIGHITIQCIKTEKGIKYIEINPRFGGGAPMSIQSGADSCENLYRLLKGENLEYNENYRDNIMFLRFDSSICLDENMEIVQ